MAEQFLEDIYKYSYILDELQKISDYAKCADTAHIRITLAKIYDDLKSLCEAYVADLPNTSQPFLRDIQNLLNTNDLIVISDLIEASITPAATNWLANLASINVDINEKYRIQSSQSGFLTLYDNELSKFIHSNINPMTEARHYVASFYDPEPDNYVIYGCGLGYHAYQLFLISEESINITIYESNPLMVELAQNYGVLNWIPQNHIKIVTSFDTVDFLNSICESNSGAIFLLSAIDNLKSQNEHDAIMSVFLSQNTEKLHRKMRHINFWRNAHKNLPCASEIPRGNLKKKFAIVAAGPSLDADMNLLADFKKDMTIIAVGTIFRRLIKENILPDFVSILDPQSHTADQIKELNCQSVPLVIDATAAWEIAELYQGPKYMVYDVSDVDSKEYAYAQSYDSSNWKRSGGTVATSALELALRLGAEEIYFFGLDLSYPKGKSHADGTLLMHNESLDGMMEIEGVMGQKVYANSEFVYYIHSIENHILAWPDVKFYNMSSIGAKINGTIEWKSENS